MYSWYFCTSKFLEENDLQKKKIYQFYIISGKMAKLETCTHYEMRTHYWNIKRMRFKTRTHYVLIMVKSITCTHYFKITHTCFITCTHLKKFEFPIHIEPWFLARDRLGNPTLSLWSATKKLSHIQEKYPTLTI
jgi:hypothetical protein